MNRDQSLATVLEDGLPPRRVDWHAACHPGPSSRALEQEPAPFCVVEVFESVAHMVLPLAEARGLTVLTLSPARERRMGHGPALRRVLLNLATNGLKFTDQGHVEIVATPQSGGRLTISVGDTGRGLPLSVVETLVRPLGLSPTSDGHRIKPAGMGLTICRRLVRSMGSELEFETSPGQGTRFHFELDRPATGRS